MNRGTRKTAELRGNKKKEEKEGGTEDGIREAMKFEYTGERREV
jgi:hypothetical protein